MDEFDFDEYEFEDGDEIRQMIYEVVDEVLLPALRFNARLMIGSYETTDEDRNVCYKLMDAVYDKLECDLADIYLMNYDEDENEDEYDE